MTGCSHGIARDSVHRLLPSHSTLTVDCVIVFSWKLILNSWSELQGLHRGGRPMREVQCINDCNLIEARSRFFVFAVPGDRYRTKAFSPKYVDSASFRICWDACSSGGTMRTKLRS